MAAPSRPRPDVPSEFESLETLHEARAPASPQEDVAPEDTGQEDGLAPILTIRPPDPDKDAARAQYGQDLSFLSAVLRGDETEAEKLLEQGADVNVHDPEHGATALHFAASRSMRRVLKLLMPDRH